MLVASHRHRPADLELWREYEEADLVHGERLLQSGKVERSIEAIREFAAAGPCYAGWSGGKDSTVLADLVARCGVPVPLFHIRAEPVANPETPAVRDAMLAAMPSADYREAEIVYRDICDTPEGNRQFFAAFRAMGTRHLSGVRADESTVRKIRMRRWGLTSENTCAPIGWWTSADVFGYLAVRGLPVHPSYAMLGGGRWVRERLRVDELAGRSGDGMGRAEWEKEYYGDVLRRLSAGIRGGK